MPRGMSLAGKNRENFRFFVKNLLSKMQTINNLALKPGNNLLTIFASCIKYDLNEKKEKRWTQ